MLCICLNRSNEKVCGRYHTFGHKYVRGIPFCAISTAVDALKSAVLSDGIISFNMVTGRHAAKATRLWGLAPPRNAQIFRQKIR